MTQTTRKLEMCPHNGTLSKYDCPACAYVAAEAAEVETRVVPTGCQGGEPMSKVNWAEVDEAAAYREAFEAMREALHRAEAGLQYAAGLDTTTSLAKATLLGLAANVRAALALADKVKP